MKTKNISDYIDEINALRIENELLKRDKKTLVEAVEKMASDARNQLHNLEKTLDLFRIINRNVRTVNNKQSPPPEGVKRPVGSIDGSNIMIKSWSK
ncbi:hypothetical protein [Fluviispira vulneris]|uniref:hypothetical protein n=1 Tax=Fluviispira vulneris TaxID=2763012 RepID=UPI0016490052|nr:hypothetical protein [Fluviispira vulneris]